jgi:predicted nucleic acid-binding protein
MESIYLETTIPSFLFDDRPEIKFMIETTKDWWAKESTKYKIFISPEIIKELSIGDYPQKEKILQFALKIELLLAINGIVEIIEVYLSNNVMPKNGIGDAMHLAYCSYYKIDYLLTWNCKHLANANKKQHIRIINNRMGLYVLEIITPLELFSEE